MGALLALACAAWAAPWWRLRGSSAGDAWLHLPVGGQITRAICALMIAAPALIAGVYLAAALTAALFLGMVAAGWGKAMDIGRVAGRRLTDALGMSGWGLVATMPTAAVLWWFGLSWWPLLIAGVAFGPIYALCWWLSDVRGLPRVRLLAAGPTEWGEVFVGAVIGAALGAALTA